jgi:hypothetical protein
MHLEIERQATLTPEGKPCPPPAGFFSARELVMDEGFPPHTVGFMRRKREGAGGGPRREALATLINEIPRSVHDSVPEGGGGCGRAFTKAASTKYLRSTH